MPRTFAPPLFIETALTCLSGATTFFPLQKASAMSKTWCLCDAAAADDLPQQLTSMNQTQKWRATSILSSVTAWHLRCKQHNRRPSSSYACCQYSCSIGQATGRRRAKQWAMKQVPFMRLLFVVLILTSIIRTTAGFCGNINLSILPKRFGVGTFPIYLCVCDET